MLLCSWAIKWQIKSDALKCKLILLGKKISKESFAYKAIVSRLSSTIQESDFRVLISSSVFSNAQKASGIGKEYHG